MCQKNVKQSNNRAFEKQHKNKLKQTCKYTIEKITLKETEQAHVSKTSKTNICKNILKNLRKNISLKNTRKTTPTM